MRLVAISVDPVEVTARHCEKQGYTFVFLSDPKAEVVRRYDLLHPGGHGGEDIARPAEFLVDPAGVVRWVNLTENFRVRSKGEEILKVLDKMGLKAATLPSSGPVKYFRELSKESIPFGIFESGYPLFEMEDPQRATKAFEAEGQAWAGDLNDDAVDEILIMPNNYLCGTGGCPYHLFEKREKQWISMSKEEWLTFTAFANPPHFDIFPTTRQGYHDIRVAVNECFKWDGKNYILYEPADYRQLSPDWFDSGNFRNAEILWLIRYSGLKTAKFEPRWVQSVPEWAKSGNAELEDPTYHVKWVAIFKGGVYGLRSDRAFLLLPQPAYQGASKLEFEGDWLLIYAQPTNKLLPVGRFNRRTGELRIDLQEWR